MIRPWPRKGTEVLVKTPVFTLRRDQVVSPRTNAEHGMYVLETGDWINIVPLTRDHRVVLVRQWRHGTRTATLEIPGGLVDPTDTSLSHAALRELREETGYAGREAVLLGTVEPNPAIQTTSCHTYLAEDVELVGEQELDHGEDIAVETVPLSEIPRLIDEGQIRHALVVAAFAHLERYRRRVRSS